MKKIILYKYITKPGIFIVYIVYVLWRKKQTNKQTHILKFWVISADLLPETESSQDELVCLRGGDVGVYIRAPHVNVWIWKARTARGRNRIRYNELRRENWASRRFHTDYFNIEYLFWTWLTSFKSKHLTFMYLRQVFAEIQVVLFTCLWRKVTETEPAENAPCLFY